MRVIFEKVDLDTCLVAFMFGVTEKDELVAMKGGADPEDLNNPAVLCIEAGGSGDVDHKNFDHHDIDKNLPPACVQAYEALGLNDRRLRRLVDYVSAVDTAENLPKVPFPLLSSVFSGMLLVERDPVNQLLMGIKILKTVYNEDIDPFETMPLRPEWLHYIEAKRREMEAVSEEVKNARFFDSSNGLKIAFCELRHYGGSRLLYSMGCDVVILFNPEFGENRIRKFTIGTTGVSLAGVLEKLGHLEPGWGGRETIIGSPKNGSSLDSEQVIQIVISNL